MNKRWILAVCLLVLTGSMSALIITNRQLHADREKPLAYLEVDRNTVSYGQPVIVGWATTRASSCKLSPYNPDPRSALLKGVSQRSLKGAFSSRPITKDTTYVLRCMSPSGKTTVETVTVRLKT